MKVNSDSSPFLMSGSNAITNILNNCIESEEITKYSKITIT